MELVITSLDIHHCQFFDVVDRNRFVAIRVSEHTTIKEVVDQINTKFQESRDEEAK